MFENIEQGITYQVEIDEQTGFQEKVISESRNKKVVPTLSIADKKGVILRSYNLPVGAHLIVNDGDKIDALNGYTIQVMGSYDISAINKFKNSTKLGSKMYVYKTMLGSKEWNILVYNSFKSYPEAKHEQATLRSRYFLQNVWVKSLDVVHKEMRKI